MRQKNKKNKQDNFTAKPEILASGFTLVEVLVVISIIALLASLAIVSLNNARQKARDVRRLTDMQQMHTAMELFFAEYKGYPRSQAAFVSQGLVPKIVLSRPAAPQPPDGTCAPDMIIIPGVAQVGANNYYYLPAGVQIFNPLVGEIYSDYDYYFCLGGRTGSYAAGPHVMKASGIR